MKYLKKGSWKMGKMDGFKANGKLRISPLFLFVESNLCVQTVGEEGALGQVGMQIAYSPFGMKSNAYTGGRSGNRVGERQCNGIVKRQMLSHQSKEVRS
jgi:hypothetical protein